MKFLTDQSTVLLLDNVQKIRLDGKWFDFFINDKLVFSILVDSIYKTEHTGFSDYNRFRTLDDLLITIQNCNFITIK